MRFPMKPVSSQNVHSFGVYVRDTLRYFTTLGYFLDETLLDQDCPHDNFCVDLRKADSSSVDNGNSSSDD